MITKEDLIKGTNRTEKVPIKGLGEIEIRPLNEEQWSEIEGKSGGVLKAKMEPVKNEKGEIDWKKTQENIEMQLDTELAARMEFEQNVIACKYGLVMDITEEELRHISPPGVIRKIALEIFRISGVSKEQLEELKSFRT